MKKVVLAFVVLFLSGSSLIYAQTQTLKGKVTAFKAYPVNNVSIYSKKLKTETVSDLDGNFTIQCHKKDKLSFKAAGFQNLTIKTKGEASLKVNLILINHENAFKSLVEENHMTQSNLDYCINNLMYENNNFDQLLTVYDVIQYVHPSARISSDVINNSDGQNSFGTSGSQIILGAKGPNSILASPFALLVVDGIVTRDISGIVPEQIKTVKVFTGSDAGHWGTRGGNGVVEITLKYE